MKQIAGAFLLGALTVAGFAPLYWFLVPVVTLALLLALIETRRTPRNGFKLGFAFGLGHFLAGVSWVYVSLHDFGAMPAPVAAGVTLLFCAYLALFPACTMALAARIDAPVVRRLVVFPAAWIVTEWIRGWFLTGFPWLAIGYSQAPGSPLAGLAPIGGLYLVGLATVLSAGLARHIVGRWRSLAWQPALGLLLLWLVAGGFKTVQWTTPEGEPLTVSLLQGNVPQSMKWRPEQLLSTLQLYDAMVHASNARLIILPETAVPLFLQEVPPEFLQRIAQHARAHGADVLIGLPERGEDRGYFNSVVSIGASPSQTYRKSHLVPFGEFIPLRPLLAPIVNSLAIPLTDFSRGAITQQPLAVAGQRVAINICYEDAFGEEIIRQLPAATLLVNVSNVAWFGDSIAPMQHLQIAQMRSLETGRFMLRSTNTGMTAVVDPRGNVVASAATFKTEAVEAQVRGYTGATPYVRFGNLPAIAIAGLLLLAAFGIPALRARTTAKP